MSTADETGRELKNFLGERGINLSTDTGKEQLEATGMSLAKTFARREEGVRVSDYLFRHGRLNLTNLGTDKLTGEVKYRAELVGEWVVERDAEDAYPPIERPVGHDDLGRDMGTTRGATRPASVNESTEGEVRVREGDAAGSTNESVVRLQQALKGTAVVVDVKSEPWWDRDLDNLEDAVRRVCQEEIQRNIMDRNLAAYIRDANDVYATEVEVAEELRFANWEHDCGAKSGLVTLQGRLASCPYCDERRPACTTAVYPGWDRPEDGWQHWCSKKDDALIGLRDSHDICAYGCGVERPQTPTNPGQ